MHCFELGGPGCSGHQGFQSLAPLQRSGSPSGRGGARRAQPGESGGMLWAPPTLSTFYEPPKTGKPEPSELHQESPEFKM